MAHTHAMPLLPFFANSSSSCCSFMVERLHGFKRLIENLHAVNSVITTDVAGSGHSATLNWRYSI